MESRHVGGRLQAVDAARVRRSGARRDACVRSHATPGGDEWFTGTCGANRRDGAVWATRVCFDAAGEWPATASWHVLAEEEYETLAGVEPTRKRRRA